MEFALDIGQVRGLGTLVVMIAFIGLCVWVFNRRRDRDFAEARMLPFDDEHLPDQTQDPAMRSTRQ